MAVFNTLLGIQTAAQLPEITRRNFLGLGGLTALSLIGCGGEGAKIKGGAGTGGADTGIETERPMDFRLEANFAQLPCRYPADLEGYKSRILALATPPGETTGDHNHLARFNPNGSGPLLSSIFRDIEEVGGRRLNQFFQISDDWGAITANDGFYTFPLSGSGSPHFVSFPEGVSMGNGLQRIGNKLFVATSNGLINPDGVTVTFGTGQIQIYDLAADGSLLNETPRSRNTSRRNPTGLAVRGSQLVILNSAPYGSVSTGSLGEGSVDLMNASVVRTIVLGDLYAQVSGEIALSEDGNTAVIGTADGSGRVILLNLETEDPTSLTLPGTTFHSSVKVDRNLAYVTDYGREDLGTGSVTVLDLAGRSVLRSIALMFGAAGPSEVYEGFLLQAGPYRVDRIIPQFA